LLTLAGWLYLYLSWQRLYILFGAGTLVSGVTAFLLQSRMTPSWPIDPERKNRDAHH
jgi:hypothetical protein